MERFEAQVPSKLQQEEKAIPIAVEKEAVQQKTVEYNDLCVTCNNAPECTSRKNIVRPVYFCENFDDYVPQKHTGVETKPTPEKVVEEKIHEFKGLCVNCNHRDTCAFPKPEGGVWHCEEYE